jgi:acetylornithine deacetylase
VVGEEENGDGARTLMRDFSFPWVLIAEPSRLRPCLGSFGYLELAITATGIRRHASLARPGGGPVAALMGLVLTIAARLEKEEPEAAYNIRELFTSSSGFAVPERCEARLDIHLPPSADMGRHLREIESVIADWGRTDGETRIGHRVATIDEGYELPPTGTILETLRTAFRDTGCRWSPEPFRSHSDAGIFRAAGSRPVICGPGELALAHHPEEWVSFREVVRAAKLYEAFVRRLGEETVA